MSTPVRKTERACFLPTNSHLYHYAGNNPVRYTDPDGRDATNTQKYYIAARLEKSMGTNPDCEIIVNIPRFNLDGTQIFNEDGTPSYIDSIDTLLIAPGETAYGRFDGAMDWEGNFYKVTSRIGVVDFIVIDKDMIILSNGSGLLNTVGDLAKRIPIFGGDNPIFSGTKLVGSPDANELTEKWYPTIKKEVGEPAKWMLNYNTIDQYSLRIYLNEQEQKRTRENGE